MGNEIKQKIQYYILIFIVLVLLYLIYQRENTDFSEPSQGKSKEHTQGSLVSDKKKKDRANEHLFLTNEKIRIENEKNRIDSLRIQEQGRDAIAQPADLSHEDDFFESKPSQGTSSANEIIQLSPDEIVQQQLFNNQIQKYKDEKYKAEYAKQFIENARKGGFEIKLNSDYEVISVKPIRK